MKAGDIVITINVNKEPLSDSINRDIEQAFKLEFPLLVSLGSSAIAQANAARLLYSQKLSRKNGGS